MMLNFFSKKRSETAITKKALELSEQIMNEMGAELHDDLIQRLTILNFSIDKLSNEVAGNVDALRTIATLKAQFTEATDSVRRISRQLLPSFPNDIPFEDGLHILCQNMEQNNRQSVNFIQSGTPLQISPTAQTYLFRVAQELIHNSFKHSSAWHVWVTLTWTTDALILEVEDDGTSFSKLQEVIKILKTKQNTLKMRCDATGAKIRYSVGKKGLLATIEYATKQ